jgi:hypothetical protein
MTPTHTLTELQYSTDHKVPFGLYIYEPDGLHHRGATWFRNKPQYPDEEITTAEARSRVERALTEGREIRICDRGDMLVYHAKDKRVLYGAEFWTEVA